MSTFSFDAAALLNIGTPSAEPLPSPIADEVVLHIPDGLTLQALLKSRAGQNLMHPQNWYDEYPWSQAALPAGTYHLRIPVPDSNRKTASEQDAMLPAGETSAPVVLTVAALLCICLQGGPDPLQNGWTRCAERSVDGFRVALTSHDGRLHVFDSWNDYRSVRVWASSVRTS